MDCPEHGVVQVLVPWAEPRGRFTMLFERLAIDILRHCQTVQGACEILRINWDQARAILERAVARGQARKPAAPVERIGVDEKALRRGQDYVTVVCDIDRGTAEHVSEGRTTASFREYFDSLTANSHLCRVMLFLNRGLVAFQRLTLLFSRLARNDVGFDPAFPILPLHRQFNDPIRDFRFHDCTLFQSRMAGSLSPRCG